MVIYAELNLALMVIYAELNLALVSDFTQLPSRLFRLIDINFNPACRSGLHLNSND